MTVKKLTERYDISPLVGFLLGGACVVTVLLGDGRKLSAFLSINAFAVVVGGSLGAALIVLQSKDLPNLLATMKGVFGWRDDPRLAVAACFSRLLSICRRHGRLKLESEIPKVPHSAQRQAVQLMVDGTELAVIAQILEAEKEQIKRRGRVATVFFENLGSFAPTFGIVGTVISLVSVLSHLNEPTMLAQGVAEAFIATLYGLLFANLVFLPVSMRVDALTQHETETLDMIIMGMGSLKEEEHPLLMAEKLKVFLPRSQR